MTQPLLYLIPTTLGDTGRIEDVLPKRTIEIIFQLDTFIVESVRTARRFLVRLKHPLPIEKITFFELGKHTPDSQIEGYLSEMKNGKSIGLLSEAGTPCIADPGSVIVKLAQRENIKVVPLVGPNSIILALMASGLNGQQFVFHGYLPIDKNLLVKKIKEMESNAKRFDQTQIFIETPFRNQQIFGLLLKYCDSATMLCMASDLTLENENVISKPICQWKKETVDLQKRPTVFLIHY